MQNASAEKEHPRRTKRRFGPVGPGMEENHPSKRAYSSANVERTGRDDELKQRITMPMSL